MPSPHTFLPDYIASMSAQSSLQGGSAFLTGSDEASPPSLAETPSPPPVADFSIATPAVASPIIATTKCNYRSCLSASEVSLDCQNPACDKVIHLSCFQEKYGNVYMPKLKDGQVVCTKLCYKKVAKPPKLTWCTDGRNGPMDSRSSEWILLDWLLVPGNYMNKWCGKNNGGQTKNNVAANIARLINDAGVCVSRDDKQVQNKVQHFEQQFRAAYDFANTETGQGLQINDKNSFDDAVCGLCTQYFDLFDVFHDRASSKPSCQNLAGLSSSDEDVDKNKDDSFDDDATEDNDLFVDGANATMALRCIADLHTPAAKWRGSRGIASGYAKKSHSGPSIGVLKGGGEAMDSHAHLCNARAELVLVDKEKKRNEVEKSRNEAEKSSHEAEKLSHEAKQSSLDMRLHVINRCFEFVTKHPNMSKERIVKMVPAFAAIIDEVMEN